MAFFKYDNKGKIKTNKFGIYEPDWSSDWVDKHRRGISDIEWAEMQPKGKPNYKKYDIVEFKVGGFGKIIKISSPHSGWPSSYCTEDVPGMLPHKAFKLAWHYELDFKDK